MSVEKGTPTLVAVVDNDRMALLALKGILPQLLPSARWAWEARTADEAVRMALNPETRPKLLLVDMSLGEATGVGVCRKIRMRTDRVALLGITAFSVADYAVRVAEAGAQGIVSKADIPQLARALRTVASGGVYAPAEARSVTFHTAAEAHRLFTGRRTGATDASAAPGDARHGASGTPVTGASTPTGMADGDESAPRLGAKEAETLHLLSQGLSYDQIAARWGVAASTVRTHAHRAVDKLGAKSLAHAIAIWLTR
ncbi:response regulator transcription factor [Bifidobacterium sp. MA2]|uniref:Response regulator transcription factor n=1 Tax=Bifidobacterium santillanense TaxID=2809028 RepID=A0ABS5URI1_9BIFI|nr:response regulator transcription factor [Bifidobacterium santillanense]MBT1173500.1 response regulator transcription factor [Bifidobacterium santillanense]